MKTVSHPGTPDWEGLHEAIRRLKVDTCYIWSQGTRKLAYHRDGWPASRLSSMNSITKSVLSLLIGIARDRGEFPELAAPVAATLKGVPEQLAGLSAEHLLTMTDGLDWREWGEWGGKPTPMCDSTDWARYVLERQPEALPGNRMAYNSGCSQVLSAMLQQSTGLTAEAYAARHLFGPLGINEWKWPMDPSGCSIGGFGLALLGEDAFKLGLLMLQRGCWEGQMVVPSEWVDSSVAPRSHSYDDIGSYGYHWWIYTGGTSLPVRTRCYFAMGYGGQFIFVIPERDTVVSFTAQLYRQPRKLLELSAEFFLPDPASY